MPCRFIIYVPEWSVAGFGTKVVRIRLLGIISWGGITSKHSGICIIPVNIVVFAYSLVLGAIVFWYL